MLEILKNIKTYFHILIVISVTSLAFLLSPSENDYSGQLEELKVLQNISNSQYETFIQSRIELSNLVPENYRSNALCKFVQEVLSKGRYDREFNFDGMPVFEEPYFYSNEIDPIISDYSKIPRNEPLSKWISWIKSKKNATYLKPNWNNATLGNNMGLGDSDFIGGSLRHFSIRNYNEDLPSKYRFRAFIDINNVELDSADYNEDLNKYKKGNWWTVIDKMPSFKYENNPNFVKKLDSIYQLDKIPRYVLEVRVLDTDEVEIINSSVNNWIKGTHYWSQITNSKSGSVSILPSLQSVWSEISEFNIDNASNYLINKRNKSSTISLLGISVSFYLAIIAIPFAYFILTLYMLLHFINLNRIKRSEMNFDSSWIGIYDFKLAKIITFLSLVIIPFVLCTCLILRYGHFPEIGYLILSIFLTLLNLIIGIRIWIENKKLKIKVLV